MLHVFDFVTCSCFWGSDWRSFIQPGRGKLLLEPSSHLEKCKNISNKEFEGSNYPNGPVIIRIIYKLKFIETPGLLLQISPQLVCDPSTIHALKTLITNLLLYCFVFLFQFFCSMASTFTLNFLLSGILGYGWGSFNQPGLLNFGVFSVCNF